jgi:hypothetical protein
MLAVRWYLRFSVSYPDVEELLASGGIEVDHVTIYRWVQPFTPLLAEAARPCGHAVGDRWHVDKAYLTTAGRWRSGPTRSQIRSMSSTGTCCSWPSQGRLPAPTVLARRCWSRSVRAV